MFWFLVVVHTAYVKLDWLVSFLSCSSGFTCIYNGVCWLHVALLPAQVSTCCGRSSDKPLFVSVVQSKLGLAE